MLLKNVIIECMNKKVDVILPKEKKAKKTGESKKNKKPLSSKIRNSKGAKACAKLSQNKKIKKEASERKLAEERAKAPKNPFLRFFWNLHPKRVFKWWFSKRGQKAIFKFLGACVLLVIIFIGGLFIYYRKDLESIHLDNLEITDTVNTYLDRNGVVLWKDTGSNDYRLVVDAEDIAETMYQATIAIEDKNFYSHIGVDFTALIRAAFVTLSGQSVQGGSTLTQQLIKQVYFADEAQSASRGGISRKIKELILSIELERMYSKDQIITMYLNQSPYGGRRNGVESAAQTYFNKSAKDLTLAESAFLAGIPNNPTRYNPYNKSGNEALIARQHKVLDSMVDCGFVSKEQAEEAKAFDILATVQPESNMYAGMLAPHFVLAVKSQLESKYGISMMRAGGWTIKTTIDYEAQKIAEAAVGVGASRLSENGSDNIAMVSVDVDTSQVIAMVGSIDFYKEGYGQLNVTTDALVEPGSTIKPILDYAPLFTQRDGLNYGPGTILLDENIDRIYCSGYSGSCKIRNSSGTFDGAVTIRDSLAKSKNIPAVKALMINGIENSVKVARELGDKSLCENRSDYGLSIAIGSGCGVRLVEHANAYATLARGGAYKDLSYVLEIKNSEGDILESWVDQKAKQVVSNEVAYMISDILSDKGSRYPYYGTGAGSEGFLIPGVWTATKTGTTTDEHNIAKDSLMASYSTALATIVWNGNHDGKALKRNDNKKVAGGVIRYFMENVHKSVYANNGKWTPGDKPAKPSGIQTLTVNGKTDIFPSWYDPKKNSGATKETAEFNKYNKKLAAECTEPAYRIAVEVSKFKDPVSGAETIQVDGYNAKEVDSCDYTPLTVSLRTNGIGAAVNFTINNNASYTLYADGTEVENGDAINGTRSTRYTLTGKESSIRIVVVDSLGTTAEATIPLTPLDPTPSNSGSTGD